MRLRNRSSVAAAFLIAIAAATSSMAGPAAAPLSSNQPAGARQNQTSWADWHVPDINVGDFAYLPYGPVVSSTVFGQSGPPDNSYSGQQLLIVSVLQTSSTSTSGHTDFGAQIFLQDYAAPKSSTVLDPLLNAQAITSDGKVFEAQLQNGKPPWSPAFPSGNLATSGGNSVTGWLYFTLPKNTTVLQIHLAPEGEYAGQENWRLCDLRHSGNCATPAVLAP